MLRSVQGFWDSGTYPFFSRFPVLSVGEDVYLRLGAENKMFRKTTM